MIVQHNMTALNANRQLGITNTNLARSTEKLSSGYRVNRAADDAAGLSISEKMRGQIRGLEQASTNVSADRKAIAKEVRALTSEINRIATQTQFNTMGLLSGNFKNKKLQVGANTNQTISITISSMTAGKLGVSATVIAKVISTKTGADITKLITTVNTAITKVSTQRSALGALQNRLDHTIANADNMAENLQSSESKIRDVDMADEMVAYSASSILQQAGQSMLAQANQATQGVLSLLQ